MIKLIKESKMSGYLVSILKDLWNDNLNNFAQFVYDSAEQEFTQDEIVYYLHNYENMDLEKAYDLVDKYYRRWLGESKKNSIKEARQSTDDIIGAIRANVEAILRNLDDIENGKANLDDYNESLLKKAKTEIINTNSKLSTVAGYVKR